ncbi:hypothetical protein ACFZCU_46150 [Streptomyces canus]|uniref:hypothetical protein n=1 Tax=Streptomyces canus TaxID=58343 RepID=UPI0036E846B3
MAKIRVHGGVSDANAEEVEAGEDAPTGADSAPASEEETSSPEQAKSDSPPRARTTASRSKKARTE